MPQEKEGPAISDRPNLHRRRGGGQPDLADPSYVMQLERRGQPDLVAPSHVTPPKRRGGGKPDPVAACPQDGGMDPATSAQLPLELGLTALAPPRCAGAVPRCVCHTSLLRGCAARATPHHARAHQGAGPRCARAAFVEGNDTALTLAARPGRSVLPWVGRGVDAARKQS